MNPEKWCFPMAFRFICWKDAPIWLATERRRARLILSPSRTRCQPLRKES
jgi:hypothetical protein